MLNDFRLKNGQLHVRQTGACIDLNSSFMRDVAKALGFVSEIQAIRTWRAAGFGETHIGKPTRKIAFHPMPARPWYAIWPVSQMAGLKIIRDVGEADIVFYFEDSEFAEAIDLPTTSLSQFIINGNCLDIRKSRVSDVFEKSFGRPLAIDPTHYIGRALEKSEGNGVHDGRIVNCPLDAPHPEKVYQRLIENTVDGVTYTDIRTPVVGGEIPLVYLKNRTRGARFSNDNDTVTLATPDDMFSEQEREQIRNFAHGMKLDFGGLDVLRNREDGLLYIVDVNKTDMGPPTALPRAQKLEAIRRLSAAFSQYVDKLLTEETTLLAAE